MNYTDRIFPTNKGLTTYLDELAFRTVRETLLRFFADRKAGAFGLHCVDIE